MTASIQSRFWKFFLRNTFKKQHLTIADERDRAAKSAKNMGRVAQGVVVERIDINDTHAAWLYPSELSNDAVILYLHGGGYVVGGIDNYQALCGLMAQTLGIKVILPEYRLAPEHPFPAALDDALKIYHWLLSQGYQAEKIILAGDSAGGGLSLAATLTLRDQKESLPAGVVCISPWADLTCKGRSHITQAKAEAMLRTDVLLEWAACYAGKESPENPLLSPLYADFQNFPLLLIQVGSDEILLDDARMLAEKARSDGVDVTLQVWEGLWHAWPILGNLIPESRAAFEEMGKFIEKIRKAKDIDE